MNFHEEHKFPKIDYEKFIKDKQDEYNHSWYINGWGTRFTLQEIKEMRAKHWDERLSYMLGFNPFLELKL